MKHRRNDIHGHQTSLALEPEYWRWLYEIAAKTGVTIRTIIEAIAAIKNPHRSLASELRVAAARRRAMTARASGGWRRHWSARRHSQRNFRAGGGVRTSCWAVRCNIGIADSPFCGAFWVILIRAEQFRGNPPRSPRSARVMGVSQFSPRWLGSRIKSPQRVFLTPRRSRSPAQPAAPPNGLVATCG
jgi:predicted DNA-binding ribbon-helix-helix protein